MSRRRTPPVLTAAEILDRVERAHAYLEVLRQAEGATASGAKFPTEYSAHIAAKEAYAVALRTLDAIVRAADGIDE